MKGISTEQKQFSALNTFIQPPPTKQEEKQREEVKDINDNKGLIKRGSQKQ